MKKYATLLALAALLMAPLVGLAQAGEARTLTGQFNWVHNDNSGDLEAVFTPTGEGVWRVSFQFSFRGQDHTYTGTAEGSLSAGNLKGEVKNENEKRTFTFTGSFEEGKFSGTHAEITSGEVQDTGTLTLGG